MKTAERKQALATPLPPGYNAWVHKPTYNGKQPFSQIARMAVKAELVSIGSLLVWKQLGLKLKRFDRVELEDEWLEITSLTERRYSYICNIRFADKSYDTRTIVMQQQDAK